jgi:hypothetical protein
MLIAAGDRGCTNGQLWEIAHATNSRISDLRSRGHKIIAECEGSGTWRYTLTAMPEPAPRESAAPAVDSADWYVQQTGEPRPSADALDLPLFAGVR